MALGSCLLQLYYQGSRPYRWWHNRRLARHGKLPLTILLYHRVADDGNGPWTMPRHRFQRQIEWLRRHADLIGLEEMQRRIRYRDSSRRAVAITFDDGYADNSGYALPWLIDQGVHFTYFVTLENILSGEPFRHDARLGLSHRPNSLSEIKDLAAAGVAIGCHGRSHKDLGKVFDRELLQQEVVRPGRELEDLIAAPVHYYAFPAGSRRNVNALALRMLREAGYLGACSSYGGYNFPGREGFHLRRYHAEMELVRLKNRVTIDPRRGGHRD